MKRNAIILPLLLGLGSSFVACGCDHHSPPPADHQGPLPESQFLPELLAALCDGMERCCSAAGLPHKPDVCRRYVMDQLDYNFPPEHRDRFEYDPVAAGECVALARRTSETCLSTSMEDGLCWTAYKGITQPGEECVAYLECAVPPGGGARCDSFSSGGIGPRCRSHPRGVQGDPCNGDCTEGLEQTGCGGQIVYDDVVVPYCYATDGLYCREGFCRPLLPVGAPCGIGDQCVIGAVCACEGGAGPCETGQCVFKRAVNEPCGWDGDCRAALYCDASSTCQHPKPAGAPCDRDPLPRSECQGFCGLDTSGNSVCEDALGFPLRMCDPGRF